MLKHKNIVDLCLNFWKSEFDFEESLEKLITCCNKFDNRIDPSYLDYPVIAESLLNLSCKFNFEWNQKMFHDDN
jgi:hypothetical protein